MSFMFEIVSDIEIASLNYGNYVRYFLMIFSDIFPMHYEPHLFSMQECNVTQALSVRSLLLVEIDCFPFPSE